MIYYDTHTHSRSIRTGTLSVVNISRRFERAADILTCSVGLHPWFITDIGEELRLLEASLKYKSVVAIGECGLDRLCNTSWDLQTQAFRLQVELALKYNMPLLIHCVKAYDEVAAILAEHKGIRRAVFHGFNRKWQVAEKLLSSGYCLSFGTTILKENSTAAQTFQRTPDNCFLLETDNSGYTIEEIYLSAAHIRNITVEAIAILVESNFNNLFSL